MRRLLLGGLALLLIPGIAPAQDDPLDGLGLGDDVLEILRATDDEGAPVLSAEVRQGFADLPRHARDLFASAVEDGLIMSAEHAGALLGLDLQVNEFELLMSDNCILCHTDADMQFEETLFRVDPDAEGGPSHLSLPGFLAGVHFRSGLSCSGCHGGSPEDLMMTDEIYERWPDVDVRHEDRTWIPEFCSRCHSDPAFMRGFDPGLPTDQLSKYRTSRHGQLLLGEGDSQAAQCVSCHGVHGIRDSDSRQSLVHPQAIPTTCGRCHSDPETMAGRTLPSGEPLPTDQLAQYRESVHGRALLERGDLGAPACNDCHGNHAAMPPEVAHVSQVCRTCHARNGSLFDGSQHKKAFEEHEWPECGRCHGEHEIEKTSDAMLGTNPGDLCHDCHVEYAPRQPECIETANHFHESIRHMVEAEEELEEEAEWVAENGLDGEVLQQSLQELHDVIRQSRSAIHSFDRSDFDETTEAGFAAIERAETSIDQAEEEFDFRRQGLAISIAIMIFLALLLALKIRQVDRRDPTSDSPAS